MFSKKYKLQSIHVFLLLLLFCSFLLGTTIGSVQIPILQQIKILSNFFFSTEYVVSASDQYILFHIRLPRVILGILVGFSLAFSGAIMQAIFRNPLADPYLLGVASGATSGAAFTIILGFAATIFLPIGAFVGGSIAVAIAYLIAHNKQGKFSDSSIILAGVAIGAMFSAVTTFLIFISGNEELRLIMFWMMGSLAIAKWSWLFLIAIPLFCSTLFVQSFAKQLNALSLGDNMAFHLGVNPLKLKKTLLFIVTLLTSAIVCVSGTIGFVGIIIPHTARLLIGANHQRLLIVSGLLGAIFLVLCDIIARTLASPIEIPIGVITAIFGVPFFLFLLLHNKRDIFIF